MIRKLIQLSPSTGVVSLPSAWIKKNKLKKGDYLFVDEKDNRIMVSVNSDKSENQITLDISQLSGKLLWSYFDAAYIAGYDEIIVITKDPEQTELLTKLVKHFPGMMIYDERKNMVKFKDIVDNPQDDVAVILSRIFNMNIAMLEDGIEAMKNNDWKLLVSMKKRDFTINSYVSYCFRQLNKFGYERMSKIGIMHTYIKILEMLSDKYSALFLWLGDKKLKTEAAHIEQLLNIHRELHRLHFGFSLDKLKALNSAKERLSNAQIKNPVVYAFFQEITSLLFDIEELEMQLKA